MQTIDSRAFTGGNIADRRRLPDLSPAGHVMLPAAIFAVSVLTVEIKHMADLVTTLWPPNAVILVALLCHRRTLPNYGSIFAGGGCAIALANLVPGTGVLLSVMLAAANLIEVAIAWALLSAFQINASNLISFRNLLIFILIASIASLGSNALGAMAIGAAGSTAWHSLWVNSYPAHALGMIIVAPFLIGMTPSERDALRIKQRLAEAAAIFVLIVAVAVCAAYFRSILFIVVLAILLATVRFGIVGATVAIFVMTAIFAGFLVTGTGEPLVPQTDLSIRVLALQILIAFMSLWSLPIAALLTERNALLTDLSLANSQLRLESERKSHMVIGLHRHLSIAEEKERLRLSHELHDQAGQSLVAAILELSEVDPLVNGAARQRLQALRKRMEEMGKTLHRIAWELRPPSIDELGLGKALASYIEDWGEQCDTEVDFHCDDPGLDEVPDDIGLATYRVVQEALTNIVKHAQRPNNVSVVLRRVNAALQVIIEDNGCGFDASATAPAGHNPGLGLDGMRERLLLIGGTLDVESSVGAGTTIFARIPLPGQRSAA